ncbi:glycosyltransferase family 4 protein [Flavobacterium sp. CYK-4]|uniref:glycosyltransferase family 4 protein n=1 Tax=Flavobacterium lotistagni TaxID=2709660 RepID=UPI00140A29D3|nr:glycosyltransferase family 4 protein [Flavobacterium lotistagni]NHM06397.1 glycosyltransferase family 4 protein [Flavobacterium lotistagni]
MKTKLLYIGNKLSQHGLTVTSIETLGALLEKEQYEVIYASTQKIKLLRLLDMLLTTFRVRKQVDFVLIDTYSTKNFWYAFFVSQLCRLLKMKYIPKLHGGDLPNRLKRSPQLCDMIFKYAYINIAPSFYLLEAFNSRGYAFINYIPNTIELQNYPFKVREKIAPKLLWVRSFTSIYNPEMAIRVFEKIKQKYPEAELCMVGPDKDGTLEKIKSLAKSIGLPVDFTGRLSKQDWIKRSEQYDIFINTTHFDNTPVSVIEAMALGLPIVSTNVGGITYLLEDHKTALLVNDSDIEGMVQAIYEIIDNPELKNHLVANGHQLVQEFDWIKVREKWEDVLKIMH